MNPMPPWDFRDIKPEPEPAFSKGNPADTVYFTPSGGSYHRLYCYHLHDNERDGLSLQNATAKRLEPCRDCVRRFLDRANFEPSAPSFPPCANLDHSTEGARGGKSIARYQTLNRLVSVKNQ